MNQPVPWPIAWRTWFELMVPLRTSAVITAQTLRFRINPDLGVVGYADVGVYVNGDDLFRTGFEGDVLSVDICGISGTVSCNLIP